MFTSGQVWEIDAALFRRHAMPSVIAYADETVTVMKGLDMARAPISPTPPPVQQDNLFSLLFTGRPLFTAQWLDHICPRRTWRWLRCPQPRTTAARLQHGPVWHWA